MTDITSTISSSNLTPDLRHKPAVTKTETPSESASSKTETKEATPLFGHRFGIVDLAVLILGAGCIIANEFIGVRWLRWALVCVCILSLLSPAVIQKAKARSQFGLGSIYRLFKKMGLNPSIDGDEISWEFQGKRNAIRIHNGCQVQIFREYPAPLDVIGKFESAASTTMDEVFSAKVGVHRHGGNPEVIFFSTELLCSSMKEFGKVLTASVGILDAAEERQRMNIQELIASEGKQLPKIGFRY